MILLCLLALFVSGWSPLWIFPLVTGVAAVYGLVRYRRFRYPQTFDQLVENSACSPLPSFATVAQLGAEKGLLCLGLALVIFGLYHWLGANSPAPVSVWLGLSFALPLYTDLLFTGVGKYARVLAE